MFALSFILSLLSIIIVFSFNRKEDPFNNHARIRIENGSVIFETAENKHIVFQSSNGGSIFMNDNNVNLLDEVKRNSNSLTRQQNSINQKVDLLKEQLNGLTQTRFNALENRVSQLMSKVNEFIGIGSSRLSPVTIRRTIQTVLKLDEELYLMNQKLSINACLRNPCRNGGKCFPIFNGFKCLCENGWQGVTCREDVNECLIFNGTDIGCQNGATCVNTAGSYRCECTVNWRGVHCSEKYDDCNAASNKELCDHGTCIPVVRRVAGQPNYYCICDQGWNTNGVNPACNIDVDECSDKRPHCSVNPPVDCYNLPGSFECGDCPNGFTGNGIACIDINECLTDNGGCSQSPRVQCTNTYGSRICGPCPPGFSGDGTECIFSGLCKVNNGGCNSRATCIENNGDVFCECPVHLTGNGIGPNGCVFIQGTDCKNNPCVHGICHSNTSNNRFFCQCYDGWNGELCDVRFDDCSINPCKNGGTCVKQEKGFYCICGSHWQGVTCEESREACGGIFQQPFGFIKFPLTKINGNKNETDCVWIISTAVGTIIRIAFESFLIELSSYCSNGFLQINNGQNRESPQIGRYCGAISPNNGIVTTNNNHVYIWYHSFINHTNDIFELSWNATSADCGDIFDSQFGTIQFPKNGGMYQVNKDCFWLVKVNLSEKIQFHISFVAIEKHESCDYDYLKIYDGQLTSDRLLAIFCNSTQATTITSSSSSVLIHFHSDGLSSDFGFQMAYNAITGFHDCGGTLNSSKGSFQSPSFDRYNGELECNWYIIVHFDDKILLEFSEFDLKNNENCEKEFVEIYDGSGEEAPLIGRFCGSRASRTISTNNELFVRYRSDKVVFGHGFTANYSTFCGGYFNSETGVLRSPNYPDEYLANQTCLYHIEVEPENIIQLQFNDFDLEDLWNGCLNDYIEVKEGDQETGIIIERLCGHRPPLPITSTVNEIWLKFVTDDTLNFNGFTANYSIVSVGCGGVLKSNSGIISPPSHFLKPFSADCKWLIVAPRDSIIFLTFSFFSLTDDGGICDEDYVEVKESDGTIIGKYCGKLNLHSVKSKTNVLIVAYKRTLFAPSEGFEINYEFKSTSSVCGGVLTVNSGFIRSPNFPERYPQKTNCTWIINAESGHQISLEVISFDLNDGSCQSEYLEIRNGHFADSPLIGKFCGNKIQPFILSHSSVISIHFESNSMITGNGFEIYFESAIRGCGGTVSDQFGTIMSPNYPLAYNHNAVCNWVIHVSKGSKVEITVVDVDFELINGNCSSDYLEIFDGNSDTSPLITRICQLSTNAVYFSTKNQMFIKFRTDSRISSRGFKLHYDTNCVNKVTGYRGVIESPNYPNYSIRELNCMWTVEVPPGHNMTFTFSHRNIAIDNKCTSITTTEIRADNRMFDDVLNICANNHSMIPLSFNSTSNVARIKFDKQTILSNFRLEWFSVGCGGEFIDKLMGSFTSPNYPNGYPKNVECLWHIQVPLQHFVVIHFDEFSLEMQPDTYHCNTDYVEVYGGLSLESPLLSTLCHKLQNSKTLSSSSNEMTVRFISDRSVGGKGFMARFEAKPGGCGGIFESADGSFTSKNYPGKYDSNDDCRWFIRIHGFHKIELSFDDFDLPASSNCSSSYLAIYDGETENDFPIMKHCGNSKPKTIRSKSNKMLVRLKGNGISSGKGFKANFKAICGGSVTIEENDHTSYEIKSSNYPYESTHLQFCNWTLRAKDPSKKIIFTFTRLLSSDSNNCADNYVEVREGDTADGPLIGQYCGSRIPAPIVSSGNTLYVYLHSNAVFRAIFTSTISTCGAALDSESGYFMSPGYPNNYPLSVECVWTIKSSPGNRISLSFENFQIESSEYCNSDYVELRENNSSGTFLGKFCGNIISHNISIGNAFWVKFVSDDVGTNVGFNAFYSLVRRVEIIGTSGILTSPRYPEVISTHDGPFTWFITSPEYTFISVTFEVIETVAPEFGSICYNYVEISNIINQNSIPIAKYCGFVVPAPLVSQSNVISITYSSSYPGRFKINWEVAKNLTVLVNETNACGGLMFIDKTSSFDLKSPGYPNMYDNNLHCTWIFNTLPGYHLLFDVLDMNIEPLRLCGYDKLKFYEPLEYQSLKWKLNKTICGDNKLILKSSSERSMVIFRTDSTVRETGFKIRVMAACGGLINAKFGTISAEDVLNNTNCEWKVTVRQRRSIAVKFTEFNIGNEAMCNSAFIMLHNGPTVNSPFLGDGTFCGSWIPAPLETSSNSLFVKFKAPKNMQVRFHLDFNEISESCGGSYELNGAKKSIFLTSPNHPMPPPHDSECDWVVSSPPNTNIRIDFEALSNFFDCDKSNDFIELRDGGTINSRLINRLCVPPKLSSYISTENMLFIRFVTSSNSSVSAFNATVSINICGGGHHISESTKIQSPNYPNLYSDNLQCAWRIQSALSFKLLSVTFEDIDLVSSSSDCSSGDTLTIRNGDEKGEILGVYCSSINKTNGIKSRGPALFIEFKSDQTNAGKGFSLYIKTEHNECGGVIDSTVSGQISTPGFPNSYPYPISCRWVLRTAFNRRIKIQFINYNLKHDEQNYKCIDEFSVIRTPIVSRFSDVGEPMPCDNLLPPSVESRTMGATLLFMSSGLNENEGFVVTYTSDDEIQCGGKITHGNVEIISYGFPGTNFGNETLYCVWLFSDETNNEYKTKAVIFEVFELYGEFEDKDKEKRCGSDAIVFGVGEGFTSISQYDNFCGNKTGTDFYYIFESNLPLNYISLSMRYIENFRGIKAKYVIQDCGGFFENDDYWNATSPGFPYGYGPDYLCQWKYYVEYGSQIRIEFTSFELESDCEKDYLIIKNGEYTDSPIIGKYCGKKKPNKITSSGGALTLIFRTDSQGTAPGFSFNAEVLSKACGGFFSDFSKTIHSPNYPKNYGNDIECQWHIEVGSSYNFELSFIDRFDIEMSANCEKDFVLIEENIFDSWFKVGQFCGQNPPSKLKTISNNIRVTFRTNNRITGNGFKLHSSVKCGGRFTGNEAVITSPGYPGLYGQNIKCEFLIERNANDLIILEFQDFDVENSADCKFDSVIIYKSNNTNGFKYGPFCGKGSNSQPPLIIGNESMLIVFETDIYKERTGFKAKYTSVSCGGNLEAVGEIESPNIGKKYLGNMNCQWNIKVQVNRSIEIEFISFSLEYCSECSCDSIVIYDGKNRSAPLIGRFCDDYLPPIIKSSSENVVIAFNSDFIFEKEGFRLVYRTTLGEKQGCGGLLQNSNGSILSPDINNNAFYDLNCIWVILVPEYATIQLTFESMNIKETNNTASICSVDFLEIRDGATHSDSLINIFCGTELPGQILSSSNMIFIHFHSDKYEIGTSFRIRYEAVNNSCGDSFQVTNTTRTLTSPGYPLSIPSGIRCRYHFTLSKMLERVKFKFTTFNLSCENGDYVEFADINNIDTPYRICGYKNNFQLIGVYGIWMTLNAGSINDERRKFSLDVTLMNCNETFDSDSGFITNSLYPLFNLPEKCTIIINTAKNTKISLYFFDFNITLGSDLYNCNTSNIKVLTGSTEVATLCPGAIPNPIFVQSNRLTIRVNPNYSFKYYMLYSSSYSDVGCGGNLTSINGVFTSPQFPETYKRNSNCVWYIRSLGMHALKFSFTDFDFNSNNDCNANFVELYDGLGISEDKFVVRYCGNVIPAVHYFEGNTITVRMVTNTENEGIGFRAKFIRSSTGFSAKNKIMTSFSKPEIRKGVVHLDGL